MPESRTPPADPNQPSPPQRIRVAFIGALVGCLVGVILGAIDAWWAIFRIEFYGGEVRGSTGFWLSRLILGGAAGALVGWVVGKTWKNR
jgi:hypothetical protein